MNSSQIKTFLQKKEEACLYDFSVHFNLPEKEMKRKLDQLVEENKVNKAIIAHCCNSGCSECYTDVFEFYSWNG